MDTWVAFRRKGRKKAMPTSGVSLIHGNHCLLNLSFSPPNDLSTATIFWWGHNILQKEWTTRRFSATEAFGGHVGAGSGQRFSYPNSIAILSDSKGLETNSSKRLTSKRLVRPFGRFLWNLKCCLEVWQAVGRANSGSHVPPSLESPSPASGGWRVIGTAIEGKGTGDSYSVLLSKVTSLHFDKQSK